MSMIDFYHYTTKEGKDAILRSKVIKASKDISRDAVYGFGVYGTTLNPHKIPKTQVAMNNYDDSLVHWLGLLLSGRVDVAIKIRINKKDVVIIHHGDRDILVYKGDINLNSFEYEVIEVQDDDNLKVFKKKLLSYGLSKPSSQAVAKVAGATSSHP